MSKELFAVIGNLSNSGTIEAVQDGEAADFIVMGNFDNANTFIANRANMQFFGNFTNTGYFSLEVDRIMLVSLEEMEDVI